MKKSVVVFAFAGLLTGACNHTAENQPAGASSAPTAAVAPPASAPAQPAPEILHPVVLINGHELPLKTNTAELTRHLGKPDKIETGTIECGGYFNTPKTDPSDATVHYYGRSDFEVYGQQAALRTIDFRDGKFKAKLDGTVVDGTTTLEQIRRLYPQAAQDGGDQHTRTETFWTISLRAGQNSDDSWTLKFIDGKLV